MAKRASQADWDGQTRRWHDKHWYHEDADGQPVREYNTLTERMPWWAIAGVIVLVVLVYFGVDFWMGLEPR